MRVTGLSPVARPARPDAALVRDLTHGARSGGRRDPRFRRSRHERVEQDRSTVRRCLAVDGRRLHRYQRLDGEVALERHPDDDRTAGGRRRWGTRAKCTRFRGHSPPTRRRGSIGERAPVLER